MIYFLCIILPNKAKWCSGKAGVQVSIRTWVRIPGPPLSQYVFSSGIPMRMRTCSLPYTFTHPIARWPKAKSDGQALKVYMEPSQLMHTKSGKGQQGQRVMGLRIASQTPIIRPKPLSFHLIYFILIICFIISI